ncbi:zinc finger protein 318-like isoform X2 [Rhineura floridana]|uniref:zinc finger protein 318-like isoform X2 n=1 Tax=Rhineura floridana TaxID=261503 RepID=UPI002AC87F55|nr:zinc finger protein 318-like isoform X2 [Rhineura floridana]
MHRASDCRSSKTSSGRSKNDSSLSSRHSRSDSARGRRSHRSRSPSSRRRHRRRSSPSSRTSRRSPPLRHSRKRLYPVKHSRSPVKHSPSLSDANRDDLTDGPILGRGPSRPRSLERYPSHKENPSSPFNLRHDVDYRSRDVFLHQSDYSRNYDPLQDLPREIDKDDVLLRKSSYLSEDKGREPKCPRYDRDNGLLDMGVEPQGFLSGTRNCCKRNPGRSPSLPYLDEDLRELECARRKREEEELSRNCSRDRLQSSELRYLYRPNEAPAMPKKSILKKRMGDPSVQPEVFSSSCASTKGCLLLSDPPPPLLQDSAEEANFLKQFNKNAVMEFANKASQGNVHDWKLHSGQQQNTSPFEQNFGSFLKQKDYYESTSEPEDRHNDFSLPHERASQDGSGFSHILGMMADSTSAQEKRRCSLFDDIEDEEKFLYGDDEDDSVFIQRITVSGGKQPIRKKESSPPPASPSVKPDTSEESRPEFEKIHDLLKTIGLDIGVAEIGKLAARTQERLHGKKPSRSPDRHLVASHKLESRERHRSRSDTHSPESRQNRSLSPSGSFPPSKEMSSVSNSEHPKSNPVGQDCSAPPPEQPAPTISLIPSAPPCLPHLFPPPTVSQYSVPHFLPFSATQPPQNYQPPTMPPPGYYAYGHYMSYAASGWPIYAPPQQTDPAPSNVHEHVTLTVPPNPSLYNLRVIQTVSTSRGMKRERSVPVQTPAAAPCSRLFPQSSLKRAKEKIPDDRNRASQKQKVLEERKKLKAEQETRQKKLHYLMIELNRLSKQQGEMLRKKRKEEDPLLVEVNRLQEKIAKEVAQMKISADAAEKKLSGLDKVAQILGIVIFEKPQKQSLENKDSSEKDKSENAKSGEITWN